MEKGYLIFGLMLTKTFFSTFIIPEPDDPVKCWNGKEKRTVEVQCPITINQSHKHMRGVDLCNILMSLYRIKLETEKWRMYLVILHLFINGK